MPRPGFVLDVDRSTPATLFWHGEGFRLEKLPADRSGDLRAQLHDEIDDVDGAIRPPPPPDRHGPASIAAVPRHEAHDRIR